jgi:hypothetical protein
MNLLALRTPGLPCCSRRSTYETRWSRVLGSTNLSLIYAVVRPSSAARPPQSRMKALSASRLSPQGFFSPVPLEISKCTCGPRSSSIISSAIVYGATSLQVVLVTVQVQVVLGRYKRARGTLLHANLKAHY